MTIAPMKSPHHYVRLTIAVIFLVLAGVPSQPQALETDAIGRRGDSQDEGFTAGGIRATKKQKRLREGTKLVDRIGYFQATGDRVTFYASDGKERFRALENLLLERVARIISETPERVDWTVAGTITEFRGSNYLLLTHAVLKIKNHTEPDDLLSSRQR